MAPRARARDGGHLASSYLNAGHLGILIAVYLVGDAVAVMPTLLFQLFCIAPVAFALLERARSAQAAYDEPAAPASAAADEESAGIASTHDEPAAAPGSGAPAGIRTAAVLRQMVRNPVIVAAVAGLLLAVVTMAALPTAQNVLVYALQYGRDPRLARNGALVTTLLAAPAMLLIAALLT